MMETGLRTGNLWFVWSWAGFRPANVADRNGLYTHFRPFDGCDSDPSRRHSTRNLSQEGFVKTTNPNNPGQGDRDKLGSHVRKPGQSGQGGQGGRQVTPPPPRPDNDEDFEQGGQQGGEEDR